MVLYFLIGSIRGLKAEVAHVKEDMQKEDDNPVFEMEDATGSNETDTSEIDT